MAARRQAEPMDRQRLAAFVDGELSPEEAARVVMYLADHPEDRAYVDRIAVDRELLARAFAEIGEEPIPGAILATIRGDAARRRGGVVQVFARRGRTAALVGALAASLLAVVYLGFAPDAPGRIDLAAGPVPAGSPVAAALDGLLSGEEAEIAPNGVLSLAASFPDARGRLCREMQLFNEGDSAFEHAIACTDGDGWTVEIVVTEEAEAGDEGRFVPAEGPGGRAIEGVLDGIGAGLALTPAEEAEARSRGWRP